MAASVPIVRAGGDAQPADQPGAQVAEDVAVQVRQDDHVVQLRLLHELHAHVVDQPLDVSDFAAVRNFAGQFRVGRTPRPVRAIRISRRNAVATARVSSYHRPSVNFMMFALQTDVTDLRSFFTA